MRLDTDGRLNDLSRFTELGRCRRRLLARGDVTLYCDRSILYGQRQLEAPVSRLVLQCY